MIIKLYKLILCFQKSITAFPNPDDSNSLFIVYGPLDEVCTRGAPIACDSIIRLKHAATNMFMHSHLHKSPISRNQEISAFDGGDTGDHWKVQCGKSESFWGRENPIRLQHVDTGVYLAASKKYEYQNPIPGQLEVHGAEAASTDNVWMVQEGLFFSDQAY